MKIDDTDVSILKELEKDSRRSLKEISKYLKVPISTVHSRMKKLEESGVIESFSAKLSPELLGFKFKVIIGLNVERKHLVEAERVLSKKKEVIVVYDVTGRFDLFVVARFKSVRDLDAFLKESLNVEYFKSSETFMVLNSWKEDYSVF